ncbi:MAG: hypothetical protein JO218_01905 [Burkholderiales bacterium]|nr:hypothetical protein [Burkholderiales bacterium]
MSASSRPRLSPELSSFLEGGQAIALASRGSDHRPSVAMALACRVTAAGDGLTLLLPRMQAWQLLADVANSGRLAAVFSQPRTHRSIQVKAIDAFETVPEPEDGILVARQRESATLALAALGYDADFLRVMFDFAAGDLTAIQMGVDEIFDQSPGPRAGQRLEVGA